MMSTMWLATIGIFLFSHVLLAKAAHCTTPDLSRPLESSTTHCSNVKEEDISVNSSEVTLGYGENDTLKRLNLSFHMPTIPCSANNYYLKIVLFKQSNLSGQHTDEEYAFRSISLIPNQTDLVEQTHIISFYNIISGNYDVRIWLYKGLKERVTMKSLYQKNHTITITNNKTEEYLKLGKQTIHKPGPLSQSNIADYNVKLEPKIYAPFKLHVALLREESTPDNKPYTTTLACCQINCHDCSECSENSFCKFDGSNLTCDFQVNTAGNAFIQVQFENERCVGNYNTDAHHPLLNLIKWAWEQKCSFSGPTYSYDLFNNNTKPLSNKGEKDWNIEVSIIVPIGLILLIAATYLYMKFNKLVERFKSSIQTEEGRIEQGSISSLSPLIPPKNKKILLLYARDCDKFMDLMSHFRYFLSETCKKEVVDIYNENYEQELNLQGLDYLLDLLKKNKTSGKDFIPEVTIVIVLTECGIAHHQAQLKGSRLEYREQESFDSYFSVALKTLKEDSTTNMYNRVHVVEFTSFKVPAKSPEIFINALTRYKMPKHFKELVQALLRNNYNAKIDICEESRRLLNENINDLVSFKIDYPDYLGSLVSQVATNSSTTMLKVENETNC